MPELSVGRLVAFTDGVFAIAITLLVLNFDEPTGSDSEVLEQLTEQWPSLLAYFLSFAVIGRFWLVHHRVYEAVRHVDARLLAMNLLYLSFVVLIPFTTEVLGDYGDTTEAVVLYAGVLAAVAGFNWTMIRRALTGDHIHPSTARPPSRSPGRRRSSTRPSSSPRYPWRSRARSRRSSCGPRSRSPGRPGDGGPLSERAAATPRGRRRPPGGHVGPVEAEHVLRRLRHQAVAENLVREEPLRHLPERLGVAGAEAQAHVAVRDDFAQASRVGHQTGAAGCHRLERHQAEGS